MNEEEKLSESRPVRQAWDYAQRSLEEHSQFKQAPAFHQSSFGGDI